MNPDSSLPPCPDDIEANAALWVLRRDRGLTAAEQDLLSQWLAADPRHGDALAAARWGWDELDRLTGLQTTLSAVADPDLLAPSKKPGALAALRRPRVWLPVSLAAAAALACGVFLHERVPPEATRIGSRDAAPTTPLAAHPVANPSALIAPCERLTLEDGSVVELNRGAQIATAYSAGERRVRLLRGEANFIVAKDPQRPFIVSADDFEVRAVGTVFNVELHPAGADVVVTEGRVKLQRAATKRHEAVAAEPALLAAGQLGELRHAAPTPQINTLTPAQVEERLAWQPRLLDFTAAPLADILAKFNRRNPVQLRTTDPQVSALRLSATFRSDNVEGFVRLMESDFGLHAERRSETEIVLSRAL